MCHSLYKDCKFSKRLSNISDVSSIGSGVAEADEDSWLQIPDDVRDANMTRLKIEPADTPSHDQIEPPDTLSHDQIEPPDPLSHAHHIAYNWDTLMIKQEKDDVNRGKNSQEHE